MTLMLANLGQSSCYISIFVQIVSVHSLRYFSDFGEQLLIRSSSCLWFLIGFCFRYSCKKLDVYSSVTGYPSPLIA